MLLFVAFLLISGVAADAQPATGSPTGVWVGVISGREMGTTGGVVAQDARLVINSDGTWTMTTASWKTSGTVLMRSGHLVLDGHFISGNPGKPAGPALYDLSPWGNQALGGSGSAQFAGVHITTGVQLKKVQ
ncbi:MAG: hypothetical protein HY614_02260 [Candidatus Rokubacteria bacterium]|nr:hypothetical protein [Candidatus Rokubacteria bacterium]